MTIKQILTELQKFPEETELRTIDYSGLNSLKIESFSLYKSDYNDNVTILDFSTEKDYSNPMCDE